jgi:hypothetical protein
VRTLQIEKTRLVYQQAGPLQWLSATVDQERQPITEANMTAPCGLKGQRSHLPQRLKRQDCEICNIQPPGRIRILDACIDTTVAMRYECNQHLGCLVCTELAYEFHVEIRCGKARPQPMCRAKEVYPRAWMSPLVSCTAVFA